MTRQLSVVTILLFAAGAQAQVADHLQCFKIRDATTKASYTVTLSPTDTTFPVAAGCRVKVPAKLLCVDVQKSAVTPPPPGSPDGVPVHKFLCYKVKCPKATPTATVQDQFGIHQVTVKGTSMLCAPEPAPTTSTTTTTSSSTTSSTGCANIDNDADGYFAPPCGNDCDDNNSLVNPGMNITCGVGACQNTVPSCAGTVVNTCTPGMAGNEICGNAIDDDCDGSVDESPCQCTTAAQCPSVPNGSPQCSAGNCTFFCTMGFANCNGLPGDGCEVNTQIDPSNCNGCGTVCPQYPNTIAATCQSGSCQVGACSTGFKNCNGFTPDGCEINSTNDPANCGLCGTVCPAVAPNCVNSVCMP